MRWAIRLSTAIVFVCSFVACGRKGPPLPPLVRVPAAPADFSVERRGADVRLQFTVPSVNADGSRPANIKRIDVYGFTGPFTANDEQLVKLGTRIASLPVKAPRNPDATTEADEPPEEPELEKDGLDQAAIVQLEDPLTPAAFQPIELPTKQRKTTVAAVVEPPLLAGPPSSVPWRIYVLFGLNKSGRKGPFSKRLIVPLVPAPDAPSTPQIAYDESTINVTWMPSPSAALIQPPATGDLLPARFIGMDTASYGYHVYDVSPPAAADTAKTKTPALATEVRLTDTPRSEPRYEDTRMVWGATRCYTVRTVETISGLPLLSEAPAPACVTLKDTFPPAMPKGLSAVSSEGAISLIWDPNAEKDLAGYLVLRGMTAGTLDPITPMPIQPTIFNDAVRTGAHYWYAVQAIDKAGNASPASDRVDETAR